jgi:hypothetical protein
MIFCKKPQIELDPVVCFFRLQFKKTDDGTS